MDENESKLRQRTVGRLDRSRDPAILNAALAVLTEHGYDGSNMDDIAARAGVGKAAIYRRWSSKAALMTDVLLYWRPDLRINEVADTGSLKGDLEALVARAVRNDSELITNDLVLSVALEATRDPQLTEALGDLILLKGTPIVSTILERAVARGEITADRDWSIVAEVLNAMCLQRALSGQSVDANYVRQVVETLLLPTLFSEH